MSRFGKERDLLGETGDADFAEVGSQFQTAGVKIACALEGWLTRKSLREGALIIAALKGALRYVRAKNLLPRERLEPSRNKRFETREDFLARVQWLRCVEI